MKIINFEQFKHQGMLSCTTMLVPTTIKHALQALVMNTHTFAQITFAPLFRVN